MGITDHLTCLLRNPYVGQETTKDLHDPDNHNGVITHLEPDILDFGLINEAVDVFLEHSCFFDDSMDVGNLISGSSAFSKSSLNIWKFTVHILLKPGLENLSTTLLVCEMSAIVW